MKKGIFRNALLLILCCVFVSIFASSYYLYLSKLIAVYIILVVGLNMIFGLTGQLSFAQIGFFGLGAYTYALLTTELNIPFILALILAILLSVVLGFMMGIPGLRVKGHYFIFVTLGFGEILQLIFTNWHKVTKGNTGIGGIPGPAIGSSKIDPAGITFLYYILIFVLIAIYIYHKIENSKYGRAFKAIRDDELGAELMGINTYRNKIYSFTIGAGLSGLAGALYAQFSTYISPELFGLELSIMILIMLLIGGRGTVQGAIIGSILITFLPEWLKPLKSYYLLLYGVGIVLITVCMPDGAYGLIKRMRKVHN